MSRSPGRVILVGLASLWVLRNSVSYTAQTLSVADLLLKDEIQQAEAVLDNIYSGGQMRDLNTLIAPGLGVTLNEATAINNGGQIVANAFGNAYLLTPTAAPVPEPSTLTLFGALPEFTTNST